MTPAKVLVVDDHFLFAQALSSVIKELPRFELVGAAVTGPQALAMASDHQPGLVLLDYHLPGYGADTLIPRLRTLVPSARVIVLTSDLSDAALVNAVRAGAIGFMTKDKAIEDVIDALDTVAAGGTLLTTDQLARAGIGAEPDPAVAAQATARRGATEPQPTTTEALRWVPPPRMTVPPETLLLLRLDGVDSFAHLVELERSIERLPMVTAVYVREMSGRVASLRIGLRAGGSTDDLAQALRTGPYALEIARPEPSVLDARLVPVGRSG